MKYAANSVAENNFSTFSSYEWVFKIPGIYCNKNNECLRIEINLDTEAFFLIILMEFKIFAAIVIKLIQ